MTTPTQQDLDNCSTDLANIASVANADATTTVTMRLGLGVRSIAKLVSDINAYATGLIGSIAAAVTASATSAALALGYSNAASASATAAATSATVALAAGRVYASTGAGITNTTNGQYFFVIQTVSGLIQLEMYLNSSGTAVDQLFALTGAAALNALSAIITQLTSQVVLGPISTTGFGAAIRDKNGNVSIGAKWDGSVQINGFMSVLANITALQALSTSLQAQINAGPIPGPVSTTGFSIATRDKNGNVSEGTKWDGTYSFSGQLSSANLAGLPGTDAESDPLVYSRAVSGTSQIMKATPAGEVQLTSYVEASQSPRVIKKANGAGSYARYISLRGSSSTVPAEFRMNLDGSFKVHVNNLLMYIPITGQSLAKGQAAFPSVNTVAVYPGYALMANTGVRCGMPTNGVGTVLDGSTITSFVDLHEADDGFNGGETIASGFANALQSDALKAFNTKTKIVMATHAQGGTALSGLAKGTQPYANGMTIVDRFKALATALGLTLYVPLVIFIHGETDAALGTTRSAYGSGSIQYRNDYNSDLLAKNVAANPATFLVCQNSSWTQTAEANAATSGIPLAQFDICQGITGFSMSSAKYFLTYAAGGIHLTALSEDILGEYHEQAAISELGGKKWVPVQPILGAATLVGNILTIPLNDPFGTGFTIDTSIVSDPGNAGVYYGDDTSGATITGVAISGINLVVTLSVAPGAATNRWWSIADRGTAGAVAGPTTGPRSPIRDNSTRVSRFNGQRLYNYVIHTPPQTI